MKTKLFLLLIPLILLTTALVSAETISLNSETNSLVEVTVNGQTYTIELVSASDNSATIRVKDSNTNSQSKEINEGETKEVKGLIVTVIDADEVNFRLSATINVEGADITPLCREGESETKEINEGFTKELLGVSIGVSYANEDNFVLSTITILDATRLELSSTSSSEKESTINGKTYTIELVSSSDTVATIRVTNDAGNIQTKEINENSLERVNGITVAVISADETNFDLSAVLIVGKNSLGLSSERITTPNRDEIEVNSQKYTLELVSGSDTASTLRVTCGEAEDDDGSNNDEKRDDETDLDDDNDNENEGGENQIPDCNGCLLENTCYPIGHRKTNTYCSDNKEFTTQLIEGQACNNNFECDSNVCVSGECVSGTFIQKIFAFFKKLFS